MRISKEELKSRVDASYSMLKECTLCPRRCGVNRLKDEKGVCGIGSKPVVSSFGLHFGEERVLVGARGSGTVFFTGCSLKCVFCQNYTISHLLEGEEITVEHLAKIFLLIQHQGALNLNLVTPTHVVPFILEAVYLVYEKLRIPIVYNTGGYDSTETLLLLDGIVDIYMPDFKYGSNENAQKYSFCPDYFDVAVRAIKEMQRQVGDLVVEDGVAKKGLLIRHLVLPNGLAESKKVLDVIKKEISPRAHVNIMDQYYPTFKAFKYPELARRITHDEYTEVVNYAQNLGLEIIS
ncbi:MAG: radical SAM protein [candidate division WOR-3 bacterium]